MHVIGHDDKGVQMEALAKAHAIERVDDQALYDVALEEGAVLDGGGGDKIQVIRMEIWTPLCHGLLSFRLFGCCSVGI